MSRPAGRPTFAPSRRRAGARATCGRANRQDWTVRSAPRIVIGAGGTAGHVVPALAVADALRAEGAEVAFVGGERAELELVPQAGYELRTLRVAPLARKRPVQAARAGVIDAAAVGRALRMLGELRPDAGMGAGGDVAGPV